MPTHLDPTSGRASYAPLGERLDAFEKVTGSARYANDITRPAMLIGKLLRSPMPHARIERIETAAARSVPGVYAVITGADFPQDARFGRNTRDMPALARDKVRFIGERVAAVAAETAEAADRALELIEVDYAELDAVFDPLAAIQHDAPRVHEPQDVRAWAAAGQVVPDYPNGVSAPARGVSVAEIERALAAAHRVFTHTFTTPIQHQAYLEPHTCLVDVDGFGVVHIWASNKAPLLLTRYLDEGLGLRRDQLEVHMLPIGGDFGGKGSFMDVPIAFVLAVRSGRPVKMTMTFADELQASNPRHASVIVVRSGVDPNGRIVARWVQAYFNSGAYAAFKPSADTTLPGFWRGAVGAYEIPAMRAECHMIYTNTVPTGHMRSPGEVQSAYAIECHTDLVARELQLSPLSFRLLNGSRQVRLADDGVSAATPSSVAVRAVLETAARAIHLQQPRPPHVGRGIALVEFSTAPERFSAILSLLPDGRVRLQTPIIDNGAGQLTVFRQLLSEELHLPLERVLIEQSIRDLEIDRGLSGSRTTRLVGKLLIELVRRVQLRLTDLVAAEFGRPSSEVAATQGGFHVAGTLLGFDEAAALAHEEIREKLLLEPPPTERCVIFLAQASEVRVDVETGTVEVLRLVSVHERGRVLHPRLFQGQIDGAVAQGFGYAMMESLALDNGRVLTSNLHDYKIPTVADLPRLETILLPADASLGITPIGEGPNVGLPPAIVNALVDAVGPRVFELPLTAERVRQVIAQLGTVAENGVVDSRAG